MRVRIHVAACVAAAVCLAASATERTDAAHVPGARVAGLAGMSSTVADRGAALFGNPALLPDIQASGMLLDMGQGAIAATLPLGRFGSLSAGALDLNADDRFLIEESWNPVGTFRTGANRATVAYGVRPDPRMSLGVTLDGWRAPDGEWNPGNTLGISLTPTSVFQMGGQAQFRADDEWRWSIGAAWRPLPQFQLLTELMPDAYAVGVESAWRCFSLRAGIRSSTEPLAARGTAAYGVTLNVTPGSAVHYAYGFDTARFSEGTHSLSFDLPLWPSGGAPSAPSRVTHAARVPSASDHAAQGGASPSRAPTSIPPVAPVLGGRPPERIVKSAIDRTPDIPGNTRRSLRRLIEHHSKKYGVETPLILAMMWAESGYDPAAISASKAVGLFQLLPPAARDMGIEIPPNALLDRRRDGRFHPVRNADAGIRYMAHLLQRFDWNYVLAISAYNAGPGNVNGGVPRRRETERHVGKVLNYYYRYRNDPAQLAAAWRTIEAIPIPN